MVDYTARNQTLADFYRPQEQAAQAERTRLAEQQRQKGLAKYGQTAVNRGYNTYGESQAYKNAQGKRDVWLKMVLPVAIAATGGAAASFAGVGAGGAAAAGGTTGAGAGGAAGTAAGSALTAGGGGATAGGTAAGSAIAGGAPWAVTPYAGTAAMAPTGAAAYGGSIGTGLAAGGGGGGGTAGAGMKLGKMWDIGNLAVQAGSSIYGQKSQNKALDKQIGLQQQQFAMQQAAEAEARAEQKRQFEAAQANEARRFAAEDEDRKFMRQRQEYDLQLIREREARQQIRRQRLAQFLGIG